MTAIVRETADGWEVVDGDVITKAATQVAALDAALATYAVAAKTTVLRDGKTGAPNGAWRWIHAATAEATTKADGKRISDSSLDEAVAHLNASPRARVIDGGTSDSDVHGSEFTAGATLATGWAHAAVRAITALGAPCVYVWAEVLATLADALDTGRLAFASIAVRGVKAADGTMTDARFSSMGLTNLAIANDLQPTSAIRADLIEVRVVSAVRSVRPSLMESRMTTKLSLRTRLGAGHLALRGPAIDKVAEVARSLGVDPDLEMETSEWESPTAKAWCAIRSAAMAEKILEAVPPAEQPAARAEIARNVRAALAVRAEVADAISTACADAMKLGVTEGEIAKAIAALKPAVAEAEPKADEGATRSEKSALERIGKIEETLLRSDMTAKVDAEFTRAKATIKAEDRDALVSDLLAIRSEPVRTKLLSLSVRTAVGTPPATRALPGTQSVDVDPLATVVEDGAALAVRAETLLPELRKQFPNDAPHMLIARAQKLAAKRAA